MVTSSQISGTMKFHKRMLKHFRSIGDKTNAKIAQIAMVELYLIIRSTR